MVYTLNLNSSLDYYMNLSTLGVGGTNHSTSDRLVAGGKGINVAKVLHASEYPVQAVVAVGGFVGDEIKRQLLEEKLPCTFVKTSGCSRINVKIKADEETEINGTGAPLTKNELNKIMLAVQPSEGDYIVLSGNPPSGTDECLIIDLVQNATGSKVVADMHGDSLERIILTSPFLIKPNYDELCEYFKRVISREDLPKYVKLLNSVGVQNVLVTLGDEGAYLATDEGVYYANAPRGKLVNSTGAGDSSVAGFIMGYESTHDHVTALKYAVAYGSACAFMQGFPTRESAMALLKYIEVKKVK